MLTKVTQPWSLEVTWQGGSACKWTLEIGKILSYSIIVQRAVKSPERVSSLSKATQQIRERLELVTGQLSGFQVFLLDSF